MVIDVRNYINNCDICKSTKHPSQPLRPPLGKTSETSRFFQKIYIDFLGPYPRSKLGNIGIFVALDHYTKFPFLKAVKKLSTDIVINYLESELFHTYGIPEIVVSDNGSQFKSNQFGQFLKRYNINHLTTAVHSPQANASERVNRSVLAAIKSYISPDQKDWDRMLSNIGCALRSTVHSAIGTSPYYLTFGQNMVTNGKTYKLLRQLELLEDRTVNFDKDDSLAIVGSRAKELMRKQFDRNQRTYNLRSKEVSYAEGQEVFRRNFRQSDFARGYNAKLAPTFLKARIRKKVGNCNYELEDLQGKFIGVFHAKDIRQ